jgi:hypothetical protein
VRKKATKRHAAARKNDAPRLVVAEMTGNTLRFLFADRSIGRVLGDQCEQRGIDCFAATSGSRAIGMGVDVVDDRQCIAGDNVVIRRADQDVLVVENPDAREWRTLAEKLRWAAAPRFEQGR